MIGIRETKMKQFAFATAALICVAAPVSAQSIFDACAGEIETHCAAVEPGHGRLISCLYAHEAHFSEACDAATSERLDLLDQFFFQVRTVYEACVTDAHDLCGDVEVGGGRTLACLKEAGDAVSADCQAQLATISLPADPG